MLVLVTSVVTPPRALVEARGDLDVFGAVRLRRAVKSAVDAGCGTIDIDLSGLRFADWGGVRVVARALQDLRAGAAEARLHGVSARIAAVAAMAGGSADFSISPALV